MLCDKCGKNPATFHYTEIVNGEKSEHHLCSSCAANTDMSYYTNLLNDSDNPFLKLLGGIFSSAAEAMGGEDANPETQIVCPNCKMTYGEFLKNSSFGCATCYDVFGPLIPEKIKKIQGSDVHVGKKPLAYGVARPQEQEETPITQEQTIDLHKEIEILSKKLKDAIAIEDYEEAAKLRDLIAEYRRKESGNA